MARLIQIWNLDKRAILSCPDGIYGRDAVILTMPSMHEMQVTLYALEVTLNVAPLGAPPFYLFYGQLTVTFAVVCNTISFWTWPCNIIRSKRLATLSDTIYTFESE